MEIFWIIVKWILVIVIPISLLITYFENGKEKTNYYYWAFNLLIFIGSVLKLIEYYN